MSLERQLALFWGSEAKADACSGRILGGCPRKRRCARLLCYGLGFSSNGPPRASGCGAILYAERVPIQDEVLRAAETVSADALDFALFGGEDFELVYTVPEQYTEKVPGCLVGEIREQEGVYLRAAGKETLIERSGYDHFAGR